MFDKTNLRSGTTTGGTSIAKAKSRLFITFILCTAFLITSSVNCDKDENSTGSPSTFDIVGIWEVASIEGAGPVDGTNSTWTFNADGNYQWFLELGIAHINAAGDYSLTGNTLYCVGPNSYIAGTDNVNITITNNNNTFSLLDGDGNRWTYNRTL